MDPKIKKTADSEKPDIIGRNNELADEDKEENKKSESNPSNVTNVLKKIYESQNSSPSSLQDQDLAQSARSPSPRVISRGINAINDFSGRKTSFSLARSGTRFFIQGGRVGAQLLIRGGVALLGTPVGWVIIAIVIIVILTFIIVFSLAKESASFPIPTPTPIVAPTLSPTPTCGGNGQVCCSTGQQCQTGFFCNTADDFCDPLPATPTPSCGGNGQACCSTGQQCQVGYFCNSADNFCDPLSTPTPTGP